MMPGRPTRRDFLQLGSAGLALAPAIASADSSTVTDIVGRTIKLETPVRRVLLGEGRQIFVIGALDRNDPFGRVVGWRDDLIKTDPDSWRQYRKRDAAVASLPLFNGLRDGAFDVERAISLDPDVILLNLESGVESEAKLVAMLGRLGIAVVYVDFRYKPFRNTEPSVRLVGRLLGREKIADALVAFAKTETARVVDRLTSVRDLRKPLVMVDRIPGYSDECCLSFGAENFGRMIAMAGGRNLGSRLIPGTFGILNPETVLAADPDVVIVTGSNFTATQPGGTWVGLGPGADLKETRRKLDNLMRRPAFAGTKAVRNGRVHGIWHQFYNNPYQFVAIQRLAKWLHPNLFVDLDPDVTFQALHERFLPVPYEPGYWVSLEPSS